MKSEWHHATLGEVARWGSGGTPQARNSAYYGGEIPWAVIGDLNDAVVHHTASTITEEGLGKSSAKVVPTGALLVAMYGSIGKLGIAGMPLATNQAIAFAVPHAPMDRDFLFYYLLSQRQDLDGAGKGATQRNIGQAVLKAWPIRYPDIREQRRIVAILEEHLSGLDDGARNIHKAEMRCRLLKRSVMLGLIPEVGSWPARWGCATVSAVGSVDLGRQRHPDWHHGSNMHPYLRVANVFEDRIDTSDLMEMHWPEDTFARFKLRPGQILLNEGQSPQYLGRPAMYHGEPADVAFTNSLLRFTAGPEVLPEFALLVFRRHMHAGRFARESRITTNIAHLSATRLKGVEFPVPTLAEQKDLVDLARERLGAVSRIEGSIQAQTRRAAGLRRAVLSAAFSGRLTGHGSSTDVISELAEEESA